MSNSGAKGLKNVIIGLGVLHCTGVVYCGYCLPANVFSSTGGVEDSLMYMHFGSTASEHLPIPLCLLLGAFAELRNASISFVVSVRPSVRMEQLISHWTDLN